MECNEIENSAFPALTNTSVPSTSANDSQEISLTGYVQKLQEVAQSRPLCPKVDLAEDVAILATKVKEG